MNLATSLKSVCLSLICLLALAEFGTADDKALPSIPSNVTPPSEVNKMAGPDREKLKGDWQEMKGDKGVVDSACKTDAESLGCKDMTVGHGLLRCIGEKRREQKGFQLSEGCKMAIEKFRTAARKVRGDRKQIH